MAAFAPDSRPGDFSGENPETSAYPSTDSVVARFGTVSVPIHRQALAGLSWLSFSPPAVSAGRRAWSRPVVRIAADELPTAARVERCASSKSRTPNPRGGLRGRPEHRSSPPPHRFRYDSSDPVPRDRAGVCPGRPGSPLASVRDVLPVPSDRSCGLFSGVEHWAHTRRLYSQQPPSSRTSTSRCIRLYVPPTTTAPMERLAG